MVDLNVVKLAFTGEFGLRRIVNQWAHAGKKMHDVALEGLMDANLLSLLNVTGDAAPVDDSNVLFVEGSQQVPAVKTMKKALDLSYNIGREFLDPLKKELDKYLESHAKKKCQWVKEVRKIIKDGKLPGHLKGNGGEVHRGRPVQMQPLYVQTSGYHYQAGETSGTTRTPESHNDNRSNTKPPKRRLSGSQVNNPPKPSKRGRRGW